jgi:hypothetical protein
MSNYRPAGVALLTALCLLQSSLSLAAPSRAFVQELGRVSSSGNIYLDMYNNTGKWTPKGDSQVRFGTPYGEAIISDESIGGKYAATKEMALYAIGYLNTGSGSSSDLTAGVAYQIRTPAAYLNVNPFVRSNSGKYDLHFATALFTPLRLPHWVGETQLGAEFQTSDSIDRNTGIALGFRWLPRHYLTLDLIVAGDGGTESTAMRTPAAFRVNLKF